MDIEEVILNAALIMTEMDHSVSLDEAKRRIFKHTGVPAVKDTSMLMIVPDPKGKDSYVRLEPNRDTSYSRISWDSYFMSLAFLVAMRSPDAQTQHGCVIVDSSNRVISTGYNGFLQGAVDEEMPNLRPDKYKHIIHSEVNAVLSAKQDLTNCKVYVTGLPCNECLKVMAKVGVKEIIVGDRPHVFSEGYLEMHCLICAMQDIRVRKFQGKLASLDGREIK